MCLGVPGKIIDIDRSVEPATGTVDFGGVKRSICLSFVPEAGVDDYVLVHVGFAISVLDEAEAQTTLDILRGISAAEDTEENALGT